MAVRLVVRHPASVEGEAGQVCFEFEQARIVIGRSPGADVRLPGPSVSETHATLVQQGGHYALRDERSLNGTQVNGSLLVPNRLRVLEDGDELVIAEFTLSFHEGPLTRAATTPERTASLARRMLRELLGSEGEASAPPFLHVHEGPDAGTRVNLGEPPSRLLIGRGAEADLVLSDVDVSRLHVEVARELDATVARDLASKNGLEVNGKPLRERRLRHGDVLRIGATVMHYHDPSEEALRSLEKQAAVTLTRTRSPSASSPPAPPAAAPVEPPPEPEVDSTRPASPVDFVVYTLATFVLAASIAGLVWLLS